MFEELIMIIIGLLVIIGIAFVISAVVLLFIKPVLPNPLNMWDEEELEQQHEEGEENEPR